MNYVNVLHILSKSKTHGCSSALNHNGTLPHQVRLPNFSRFLPHHKLAYSPNYKTINVFLESY